MIDTPHRVITDTLLPDAAYALGWQDCLDALELGAEGEASLQATRHSRKLDGILDRCVAIAPWPLEGRDESESSDDGEAASSEPTSRPSSVYDQGAA